jgi:hypothetical protein
MRMDRSVRGSSEESIGAEIKRGLLMGMSNLTIKKDRTGWHMRWMGFSPRLCSWLVLDNKFSWIQV